MHKLSLIVSLLVLSGAAHAASDDGWVEVPKVVELSPWSTDLIDPAGFTRFHLVTRGMFTGGERVVSGAATWSSEALVRVRVVEGLALTAAVPLGLSVSSRDSSPRAFAGNLALGFTLRLLEEAPLRFAGGLDLYLPTAAKPAEDLALGRIAVAAIRAYEPQLYVPQLLSVRLRGHADITFDIYTADLELGFIPGTTIGDQSNFVLLFSAAARISAKFSALVEPFLEIGAATQIAGTGDIAPPLLFTPGLRLHIAGAFDPAIFVSFNAIAPSAIVIGIDLAAAVRPGSGGKKKKTRDAEMDDLVDF